MSGKSGERGTMQFLPATWNNYSKRVLGYVAPMTVGNERYVASVMIQKWIDEGHSDSAIAKLWNQGHPGKCSSGVNSKGVKYDSCAYVSAVLSKLKNI